MCKNLEERIKSAELTKTEKRIASYLLENEEVISIKSAKDIARDLHTSDTSVIRTCRSLGYSGFSDLQRLQKDWLSSCVENGKYIIPQNQVSAKYEKYKDSGLSICLNMAIENLNATYQKNDPDKFREAAEMIYSSSHVFVAGFRGLSGLATILGTLLAQFGRHTCYASSAESLCIERAVDYGPDDCIILLGSERYSKMSITIANIARKNECPVIAIVDKITSPLAYKAKIVFLASIESPTAVNSYLSMHFIIENICFELSKLTGVAQRSRLAEINERLFELGLY